MTPHCPTVRTTQDRIFPIAAAFCILSILLLGGCYSSPVPLDDSPSVRVDPDLLGTWEGTGWTGDSETLIVRAAGDYEYEINHVEQDGDRSRYIAHKTVYEVPGGNYSMFSVRETEGDVWTFAIVGPEKSGSRDLAFVHQDAIDREYRDPALLSSKFKSLIAEKSLPLTKTFTLKRAGSAGR